MAKYYLMSGEGIDTRYHINYGISLITGNITRDGLPVELIHTENSVELVCINPSAEKEELKRVVLKAFDTRVTETIVRNEINKIKNKRVQISEILELTAPGIKIRLTPIGSEFITLD